MEVPESGELSEKERVVLERNQGQLIEHPIAYTQNHRNRRCNRHVHPPILTPLSFLLHRPILPHRVRARPRLRALRSISPVQSIPRSSWSRRFHRPHHRPQMLRRCSPEDDFWPLIPAESAGETRDLPSSRMFPDPNRSVRSSGAGPYPADTRHHYRDCNLTNIFLCKFPYTKTKCERCLLSRALK